MSNFLSPDFNWYEFLFTLIVGDLILTIIGVLIAGKLREWWRHWRHGGWTVRIFDANSFKAEFLVSTDKQIKIRDDPAERDVFLKGRVSPHAWLNCEISKLLTVNEIDKVYLIDLDKNPSKPPPPPWRILAKQDNKAIEWLTIDARSITIDIDALPQFRDDSSTG